MRTAQKIIFLAIAAALGIVLFGTFLTYPLFEGIQKGAEEAIRHRETVAQKEAESGEIGQFQRNSPEYDIDVARMNNLFVNPIAPLAYLEFLRQTAAAVGVEMEFSPSNPTKRKEDAWHSLQFRISLQGSFPEIVAFVKKIENAPYLVQVESLTLGEKGEQVTASLTTRVFTQPLPEGFQISQ